MNTVICLAGTIGSGKTTLAQALADMWPTCCVRSFGDVVRARARTQHRPTDRATLQTIGGELIAEGWPAFVDALLADIPAGVDVLIVDGIRHPPAVAELRRQLPAATIRLVYLAASQKAITQRLGVRGEDPTVGEHPIEADISQLAALADIVVDATQPPTHLARTVRDTIGDDAHRRVQESGLS